MESIILICLWMEFNWSLMCLFIGVWSLLGFYVFYLLMDGVCWKLDAHICIWMEFVRSLMHTFTYG
jgi:hypothetical protein